MIQPYYYITFISLLGNNITMQPYTNPTQLPKKIL